MSEVKVNKISPRTNCGTVQLGDSGDTITIPAGATITNNGTQTGFGRTGTVDWDTTAKTSAFTAVSGNGYFVNTTSAALTMTLPATPSAGDIVSFKDYANTFDTNNLTLARNGSNIGGEAINAVISVEGQSGTLIYVDGTQGWLIVNAATDSDLPRPTYISATGGTITTCGDFKYHTFTSPGTFCVSSISNQPADNDVSYLVVAGGGGGNAAGGGGGGGGGGFRMAPDAITVTATGFPITVGGGGAGASPPSPTTGCSGSNSIFSTITSAGGGGGSENTGAAGGSGGGGGGCNGTYPGGAGNTPPVSPPQGNPGGIGGSPGSGRSGGGGGGGSAAGQDVNVPAPVPTRYAGQGGAGGDATPVFGCGPQPYYGTDSPNNDYGQVSTGRFAGGGGGGSTTDVTTAPPAGPLGPKGAALGGIGGGGQGTNTACTFGSNGATNSGGGGGGAHGTSGPRTGGTGGSGIVIIKYRYQ